ncbi:MAG: NAD-binding protein [Candidatus Micrarchaeota archaeon]|nr:NAD-binding protein [Candidatus Micrarchaeota archaeon]MDE1847761.1 NAD-binding protein [Candidatus Micrarchaeota archaeon]MDE1863904.1 NAD-binding protein [Candidatus Micrarchaeota archaeon]
MPTRPEEETRNVLVAAVIVGAVIMLFSVAVLWLLTNNIYLDAYYTIETFFDTPNTSASFNLATIAFQSVGWRFASLVGIVVIDNLSNLIVVSFVIAAVLDIIRYADIEDSINKFRAGWKKGHVIVCGYNEVSAALIDKLLNRKMDVVVVDGERTTALSLNKRGVITITGRFMESGILGMAGIGNAGVIVFASENDLDNLIGAITAKKLNENVRIMSRVSGDEVRNKMYRLGVDMCVLPEYLAGVELGESLVKVMKSVK